MNDDGNKMNQGIPDIFANPLGQNTNPTPPGETGAGNVVAPTNHPVPPTNGNPVPTGPQGMPVPPGNTMAAPNNGITPANHPVPPINGNPVPPSPQGMPVSPVSGMQATNGSMPLEGGNSVSPEAKPKEEENAWVKAIEAEQESNEVKPVITEPEKPKVVIPHTVDDLMAPDLPTEPVTDEHEKKNKKIPVKFLVIIAGVILAIVLIVFIMGIMNQQNKKSLSCVLTDTNAGMTYRTTNTFTFAKGTLKTLGTKAEYIVADGKDHTTELATLETALKYMDEKVSQLSGVKTSLNKADDQVAYEVTLDADTLKVEEWVTKSDNFVDVTAVEYVGKKYDDIKSKLEESGYTCK